ncbi:MAG: hypothetical protein M0Z49_07910 [Chloroflexi bacterium]|nr:hypothetical protein [Chloroflexota bacterium]MDA8236900.1 hypothetical protein [Chloroflexota bacterium]
MRQTFVRLALLVVGLAAVEIGLGDAITGRSWAGWVIVAAGIAVLVAGTAGFMVPLLAAHSRKDGTRDA